jgi:negative regulator of flagellin synthesis FlgM
MDMKVNGPTDPRLSGSGSVGGARPAEADATHRAAQAAAARPNGDEATVSEKARLLQKARAEFDKAPEVRQEKVESLRQAVAQGIYSVNLHSLADRLMRWIK